MNVFTMEEINLMCIYDTSSRTALYNDLVRGLRDVYEPEMADLFASALEKLEALTDKEFLGIGFYPAYDFFVDNDV
jgi:hypothetical protein